MSKFGKIAAVAVMTAGILVMFAVLVVAGKILSDGRQAAQRVKNEPTVDLFEEPVPLRIDGYDGDCMEPCISADGTYLFFNNSNAANVESHILFAKRTGENTFKYLGSLPGTRSTSKDMAPTLDRRGNFYFTSLRTFSRDGRSLFAGKFQAGDAAGVQTERATGVQTECVTGVHPVPGEVWPGKPGWIDMDCGISPDGTTLVIAQSQFFPGSDAPVKSDLVISHLRGGRFFIDADSPRILKNVNTEALEYAPSISANGLELYFTRGDLLLVNGSAPTPAMRVMIATRRSINEPFSQPSTIASIRGFVEAPTLPANGQEIFFHKKEPTRFAIYRAVRRVR